MFPYMFTYQCDVLDLAILLFVSMYYSNYYLLYDNRHKRMNAIRIRKENQVYTAEEKRALMVASIEERAKRENKILADFRDLVHTRVSKK